MTTPHPGQDKLWVIYPDIPAVPPGVTDLLDWCEQHCPEVRTDTVTRDEFQRRMAGDPVLDRLHEAGGHTRVITLLDTVAVAQWLATRRDETENADG